MKEEIKKTYKSEDGTVFNTMKECKEFESMYDVYYYIDTWNVEKFNHDTSARGEAVLYKTEKECQKDWNERLSKIDARGGCHTFSYSASIRRMVIKKVDNTDNINKRVKDLVDAAVKDIKKEYNMKLFKFKTSLILNMFSRKNKG